MEVTTVEIDQKNRIVKMYGWNEKDGKPQIEEFFGNEAETIAIDIENLLEDYPSPFERVDSGIYKNKDGDIIEKSLEGEGYFINNVYVLYSTVVKDEDRFCHNIYDLDGGEVYGWTSRAGNFVAERRIGGVRLYHRINGELMGVCGVPEIYLTTGEGDRLEDTQSEIEMAEMEEEGRWLRSNADGGVR